jgi:hypothetical protein
MILVYHKFIVDVHNLQDLKGKVALGQVTTPFFWGSIVFQANCLFTIPCHMVLKW